jgi:hypothetical protein
MIDRMDQVSESRCRRLPSGNARFESEVGCVAHARWRRSASACRMHCADVPARRPQPLASRAHREAVIPSPESLGEPRSDVWRPLQATPNPRPGAYSLPLGRTTPLVLVAIVFLVSCPRIPDPERTTVDGQDVFLIQDAPCGIGDCAEAFYINKVLYTPTHGKLPRWLRAEARRGPLFAVADPDALPPLPFVRATRLTRIEPRWIVGVRISTYQGSKWTIAWAELADGLEAAMCDADRPRLAAIIGVDCR